MMNIKFNKRTVAVTILSFILSLSIAVLGCLLSVSLSVLNSNKVIKSVECQQMYEGVRNTVISRSQSLAIPSGISQEIFEDIFSEDLVKSDINSYFEASIKNKPYNYDSSKLQGKIVSAVEKDLRADGITDVGSYSADIKDFAKDIISVYRNAVEINYLNYYYQIRALIVPFIPYIAAATIVLTIGIALLIFKVYKFRLLHKVERWLSFGFGGGALLIIAPALFMQTWGIYKRVNLKPEYIYKIFVNFVDSSLLLFEVIAMIPLLACIIFAILSEVHRSKVKQRYLTSLRERRKRAAAGFQESEEFVQFETPRLASEVQVEDQAETYSGFKKYDGDIDPNINITKKD